tara:strand:- start:2391 stop:3377 length:987 start_codon:yes stop_codon:yes gene_type:complete
MIFRSKPGKYSIFDWVNDFVTIKSKPTALVNFNGRLYVFDNNNIYRINQETLGIEDIFEGIGCLHKKSVLVTEYGMFFVDNNGIYLHDGSTPTKISEAITQGGSTNTDFYSSFGGDDNIKDLSFKSLVSQSSFEPPSMIFDSSTSSVLFIFKVITTKIVESNNVDVMRYYIWSYNIPNTRWDLWELCENSSVGKPFLASDGEICIPIGGFIYEFRGGSSYRDYTWVSKKITMEEDSIIKVFNKVKLNGIPDNVNLDGDNLAAYNKLLISTSSGAIAKEDVTYKSATNTDSDYGISGSNKKGRWLQLKLENMTEPLDSIGILYRRKSTK